MDTAAHIPHLFADPYHSTRWGRGVSNEEGVGKSRAAAESFVITAIYALNFYIFINFM